MLTKRTHIMFEQVLWEKLSQLSKSQNTSIGQLVRDAVEKRLDQEELLAIRAKAIEDIKRIRPKPFKGNIDYKELINYGRKF